MSGKLKPDEAVDTNRAEPSTEVAASRLHGAVEGCTPDGLFCPACFDAGRSALNQGNGE